MFVHLIQKDAEEYEVLIDQVRRGERVPPQHAGPITTSNIPIPEEYEQFREQVISLNENTQEEQKTESVLAITTIQKRGRGRPPGSRNKPKK
jgi:hypothetical protein